MHPETGLPQPMSRREKVAFYLAVETPAGRVVNLIITGLVLLSSVIFVVETYSIPPKLLLTLKAIETLILICFSVEYLLRLWCAERKIKYLFSIYSLIDLVVILPFFLGVIDVSFILVFRWLRILHMMRFITSKTWLDIINQEDGVILARIFFTVFAIIFIYSGLIYQVEHAINAEAFRTFFDAVYFSIVTMTTVGFGDITPISDGGRWMTLFMILTGIALIPWQVGDLIKQLVKTADRVEMPCPGCGLYFHDADAKFCKRCGTKLEKIEN